MATTKKSTVKKTVAKKSAVPKAQTGNKVKTKTPFQEYGEKYPRFASDTIQPVGGTMDRDMGFKKGQREALNKAFSKTYSNYDKNFERFNEDVKYDKNDNPIGVRRKGMKKGGMVKKKMKNGGSLSALKASTKRDKGIDPKGAYTTVQKKTLAGARGKAKLTADKQLGATKMTAKKKVSKKK